jgi:hypothetical protein
VKQIITIFPKITREEALIAVIGGEYVVNSNYNKEQYYFCYDKDSDYPFRRKDITNPACNVAVTFNSEDWYRCIIKEKVCKFKEGEKVLVRNADTDLWKRRYFSRYLKHTEGRCYYTYMSGATPWSSDQGETGWRYCKKWEEENAF